MLTFGSLFSGIGGLDLGLERAGMEVIWQVENDPYCVRVLEKHWPVLRFGDVRELDPADLPPVDLVCGGFPCQPVSVAGKRRGQADERWLWPDFARIIHGLQPGYVLVENVPGLLSMPRAAGEVFGDLHALGYSSTPALISLEAWGGHFPGERLFIVACRAEAPRFRWDGGWGEHEGTWSQEQFERLVQKELRLCVPSSRGSGILDGVPSRMDRLRALGNAVVPQVAEWIGRRVIEHASSS